MRILYLVYWGAAEPLGQSLVIPAVERLADLGAHITLVTFEKSANLADAADIARIRESLGRRGIHWIPLAYHKRPRLLAKAVDFVHAWVRSLACRLRERFDVLHARTYLGDLMGLVLAPLLGARFIYHNEGFYPDELVDAGVLRAGSLAHRVGKSLERVLYARADGIIALSHSARRAIEQQPVVRCKQTPVIVVPSCVSLDTFRWDPVKQLQPRDTLRLVYVGSVGGRYRLEQVGAFAAAAAREMGSVHLRVLTGAEPPLVGSILAKGGLSEPDWSIARVPHVLVPQELAAQHAGLHFLPRGLSEHGGSPTKVGEYWASGLPAVVTPGIGDTEEVILRDQVGVIVREHSDTEYRRAARSLAALLRDPELPGRCRRAAETHYALDRACERQVALYRCVLGRAHRTPA